MRTLLPPLFVLLTLLFSGTTIAQAPPLGVCQQFALFTAAGAFGNTGTTVVTGDIGTNAGAFSGFPPGIVNGNIHNVDAISAQAAADVQIAYANLFNRTCDTVIGTTLGNGQVLGPKTYCLGAASTLNGDLVLDAQCDPNAIFIFKIDGALSTTVASHVVLINSAAICNVFWQINGAASLGGNSVFRGTIIANGALSLAFNASLFGRGLSTAGQIALFTNTVNIGESPTASNITASGATTFCQGGSVTLSGNCGGTWNNGSSAASILVTTAGDYFVTNDNGCGISISNHIMVVVNPLPVCTISGENFICQTGQTTTLCGPIGAAGYLWNTGATSNCITVSQAGTFSVTVTNAAGCTSTCSQTVTINPTPMCTIAGETSICQGGSTILCVPAGAASYVWSTGATTNCITVITDGNYSVTVTNTAGCVSTCSQTVTLSPNPICTISGVNTICQGGSTQICAQAGADGYVWSTGAVTNCIVVSTAGTYFVTVTNVAGCTSVCSITISIVTGPSCSITGNQVICQGQSSTFCTEAGALGYQWSNGATTNCITVSAAGNYIVTVTYAGACTSVCSRTLSVNTIPPTITCPANISLNCSSSILPAITGTATASSPCAGTAQMTYTDAVLAGNCPQSYSIIRTWLATFPNGSSVSCNQTITITDNISPVITCPVNRTLTCTQGTTPAITGSASATDICDLAPVVTYSDITINGACLQNYTISRTWRATDACGNTSTCIQSISVVDNTPPTIICPANITVACASLVPVANTSLIISADNCSAVVTVTHVGDQVSNFLCANKYTISRTYRATDACGNASTCSQVITVADNLAPQITFVNPAWANGSRVNVQCYGQNPNWEIPIYGVNDVIVQDNCGGNAVVTFKKTLEDEGTCKTDGYINLFRLTWTATDLCGNTSEAFIFLALIDTIPPTIQGIPLDITVNCNAIPVAPISIVAVDECLCACVILFSESTLAPGCQNGQVLTRTWKAIDRCGNETTQTQNITLIDNQAPILRLNVGGLPNVQNAAILEYTCQENGIPAFFDSFNEASIIATGSCSQDVEVTFESNLQFSNNCLEYGYAEQRTFHWVATDLCGSTSSFSIVVRLIDNTPPVIIGAPAMTCVGDPILNLITATDDCENPFVYFSDSIIQSPCGSGSAIQRTYGSYDGCGNISNAISILLPNDQAGPKITAINPSLVGLKSGETMTMPCGGESDHYTKFTVDDVSVIDSCLGGVEVTFEEKVLETGNCLTSGFLVKLELVWTASDVCGNSSVFRVFVDLFDQTAPTFVNFVPELTIACNAILPNPLAIDACSVAIVTNIDSIVNGICASEFSIYRNLVATDLCGNSTSLMQIIHVGNGAGPSIQGVVPFVCDDLDFPVVSAFDSCANQIVEVIMVQDTISTTCLDGLVVQRKWSATDACGHTTVIHQIIVLHDTIAPSIIIPPFSVINLFIGHLDNKVLLSDKNLIKLLLALNAKSVYVDDNCDSLIIPIFTVQIVKGNCLSDGYFERRIYTWVVTDICGNSSTLSFTVDFIDDEAPKFTVLPADLTIVCAPLPPAPAIGTINEAIPLVITYVETKKDGTKPGVFEITRTWTVTDNCGNKTVYIQHITWIPISDFACEIEIPASIECNTHNVVITADTSNGFGNIKYEWEIVGEKCLLTGGQGTPEINIYIGWTPVSIILHLTDEHGCVTTCQDSLFCKTNLDLTNESLLHNETIGEQDAAIKNKAAESNQTEFLEIWPNPANNQVTMRFESQYVTTNWLKISNLLGKEVFTKQFQTQQGRNEINVDVRDFPVGNYLVQIGSQQNISSVVLSIIKN
ncbi:MAG: ice-binding family protein [Saprospiraceae bacterium]